MEKTDNSSKKKVEGHFDNVREIFGFFEHEVKSYNSVLVMALHIMDLYEKHMPIGFLRYMRDQFNNDDRFSKNKPIDLTFLDDLSMKQKLFQKKLKSLNDDISEIEDRKEIKIKKFVDDMLDLQQVIEIPNKERKS